MSDVPDVILICIVTLSGFGTVLAVDWLPEFVVFN